MGSCEAVSQHHLGDAAPIDYRNGYLISIGTAFRQRRLRCSKGGFRRQHVNAKRPFLRP
jgi:hypothetical protein